jgi:hypothetical protein
MKALIVILSVLAVTAGLILASSAASKPTGKPLHAEIEEIWSAVPNGAAVEIRP